MDGGMKRRGDVQVQEINQLRLTRNNESVYGARRTGK